jgi:hypothetical protein
MMRRPVTLTAGRTAVGLLTATVALGDSAHVV